MHSAPQLIGGMQWNGDRNRNIPVGAVDAQHGSVEGGMCGNRDRDITVGAVGAQHRSGVGGMCGDRAGSQYFAEGVLWGTRCPARTACGQRGITATARVYRLPATSAWQMAGKVQAEQGQDGSWLAHGNLLNLEVLPAGGWHTAHTCQGSCATGLPCYGAHTAPAVKLLFQILAQLCDSLGRAPYSLADCLDHVPLGKEYPMPEVALRLALPNISVRHP